MGKKALLIIATATVLLASGCGYEATQEEKDADVVDRQQSQLAKVHPVPVFNQSLERNLLRQLYLLRNQKVATHSVWRSNYGMVEGDCPSIGFGLPYDTSMTNPLSLGHKRFAGGHWLEGVIEQAEPNGVFASKNTSATWVMCTGDSGNIEPVYIESKVTAYPYSVDVNYKTDRVTKVGKANATINQ